MILPKMQYAPNKYKKTIVNFGGINYGQNYRDGELQESLGLSSEQFPCLSQRSGRTRTGTYTDPKAIYSTKDKLAYVNGTMFIYDGHLEGTVISGPKQMCTIGNKIIIFPDKKYYDTVTDTFGSLESSFTRSAMNPIFGTNYIQFPAGQYVDTVTGNGAWLRNDYDAEKQMATVSGIDQATGKFTGGTGSNKYFQDFVSGDKFYYQDGYSIDWSDVKYYKVTSIRVFEDGNTYVDVNYEIHQPAYVAYPNVANSFLVGDAVKIVGCTVKPENNLSIAIIRDIENYKLIFDDSLFTACTETGNVVVSRDVPALEYICEDSNRLWGVVGNTIYASALGDPFNFYYYDLLSIDSYAIAVGTEGDFTGCIGFGGGVLFFKENCVHKIIGSYPAAYSLYTYTINGVQPGSSKSLVKINETLYYKGTQGVYVYSGGTPTLISDNLGIKKFTGAVAGTDGSRYYISMMDGSTNKWGLYVYDVLRGIWMREGETQVVDFAYLGSALQFLDAVDKKSYKTGQVYTEEPALVWSATLCPFNEVVQNRKGYSKLYLRIELSTGATMKVEISIDSEVFTQVWASDANTKGTVMIPIIPTRCDKFSVRLSGTGLCKVNSFVREFTLGSEV